MHTPLKVLRLENRSDNSLLSQVTQTKPGAGWLLG